MNKAFRDFLNIDDFSEKEHVSFEAKAQAADNESLNKLIRSYQHDQQRIRLNRLATSDMIDEVQNELNSKPDNELDYKKLFKKMVEINNLTSNKKINTVTKVRSTKTNSKPNVRKPDEIVINHDGTESKVWYSSSVSEKPIVLSDPQDIAELLGQPNNDENEPAKSEG